MRSLNPTPARRCYLIAQGVVNAFNQAVRELRAAQTADHNIITEADLDSIAYLLEERKVPKFQRQVYWYTDSQQLDHASTGAKALSLYLLLCGVPESVSEMIQDQLSCDLMKPMSDLGEAFQNTVPGSAGLIQNILEDAAWQGLVEPCVAGWDKLPAARA